MDDEDDEDDIGGQDDAESKQDDPDVDESTSKTVRRGGKRKLRDTGKSVANDPLPAQLSKQLTKLLEFVIKYRDKFDQSSLFSLTLTFFSSSEDNRVLSRPFMRLPTQKELPEYYEMIKQPVDFNRIKVRSNFEVLRLDRTLILEKTQRESLPKPR